MTNSNLVSGLGGAAGYGEIAVPRGDDNGRMVDIGAVFRNGIVIDGQSFATDEVFVSTNGFIQFGNWSPNAGGVRPYFSNSWIAPYNIDLDTRTGGSNAGSGQVWADIDTATDTVTFTWDRVGRYYQNGTPSFSFQLQLQLQSDGATNIVFRYGDMELDSLLSWAQIGYRLGTERLDNPLDTTTNPEDFDTTPGNTGVAGVWSYLVNLTPITGTARGETLTGTSANDYIRALGGDDTVFGRGGDDRLFGNAGNDRLFGMAGDDELFGWIGNDVLNGGAGNDTANYEEIRTGLTIDLQDPTRNTGDAGGDTLLSIENLSGTGFDDDLSGDGGDNRLIGRSGDDRLAGRGGDDRLEGRMDDDHLEGGLGDDHLLGGDGNDILNGGGTGVVGYDGADLFDGGSGVDFVSYETALAPVVVDLLTPSNNQLDAVGDRFVRIEGIIGSSGGDRLMGDWRDNVFYGRGGDDELHGLVGDDTLVGGDGNDTLRGGLNHVFGHTAYRNTLLGGAGDDRFLGSQEIDTMIGGTGRDTADYTYTQAAVIDLADPLNNDGSAAGDILSGIENLTGSYEDDELSGDAGDNALTGMAGDDALAGRGGDDRLEGRAGEDRLDGGAGDDALHGGGDTDTFVYNGGADRILDFAGDLLHLDDALWGGTALSNAQILAMASVTGGDTVFDFGAGNTLTIENYTNIAGLDPVLSVI